jgi:hypothetical protein
MSVGPSPSASGNMNSAPDGCTFFTCGVGSGGSSTDTNDQNGICPSAPPLPDGCGDADTPPPCACGLDN